MVPSLAAYLACAVALLTATVPGAVAQAVPPTKEDPITILAWANMYRHYDNGGGYRWWTKLAAACEVPCKVYHQHEGKDGMCRLQTCTRARHLSM